MRGLSVAGPIDEPRPDPDGQGRIEQAGQFERMPADARVGQGRGVDDQVVASGVGFARYR